MIHYEFIKTLDVANGLGECILWQQAEQKVYWTDMPGNQLFIYSPQTGEIERIQTPENLCSFGFIGGSDWLICAFQTGIARFHPVSREIVWEYRLPNPEKVRMNDGRVDSKGRFWVGSLVDNGGDYDVPASDKGRLFCYEANGNISEHLDDIHVSNSLCWSGNDQKLYFADSPRHEIYQFDFDLANGSISNKQFFAKTAQGISPDGSVVDSEGYLWNAQWGDGEVVRYAPGGRIDSVIKLPVKQVTCLTFGGPNLDCLYITTANYSLSTEDLQEQPQAGNVFVYQTSIQGRAENYFANHAPTS